MNKLTMPILLVCWMLYGTHSEAKDHEVEVNFEAGAGYEYDSNAGIPDIDANTGESDRIQKLNAGVNASFKPVKDFQTRLGYDYSASVYDEFEALDLDMHHALADFTYRLSGYDVGLTTDYFDADLDDAAYLSLTQFSPSVARLFNDNLYVRAALTTADKSYASLPERDATALNLRGDAYFLLDGMRRYLAVGLIAGSEDAESAELDYDAVRLSASYVFPYNRQWLKTRTKLRVQYEDRSYDNVTAAINAVRNETRLKVGVSTDFEVNKYFGLQTHIDFTNNDSNLPAADLNKFVVGLNIVSAF